MEKERNAALIAREVVQPKDGAIELDGIMKILPHRDPFLLVDSIDAIDLPNKCIRGRRLIHEKDPVFEGHFPHFPIYPGVLHVEMTGQLGICLYHFLKTNSPVLAANTERIEVRLLKILHVFFQYEVLPGDNLTIVCRELESDAYKSTGIGQIQDLTASSNGALHIFEIETSDSIFDQHTADQWRLFAANAKHHGKTFIVVVPKGSEESAQSRITQIGIQAEVWTVG